MGGDNTILIVLVVLVLLNLVASYFAAKTWQVLHIVLANFVFIGVIVFTGMAAMTLKTQKVWREKYNQLQAETQKVEADNVALADGTPEEVEAILESVSQLRRALGDVLLGRGRVWRGCTPSAQNGNQYTLSTAPAGAAPEEARPNRLEPKMVLYAFVEAQSPDGWSVPTTYLGEYEVTAATENSVTITPTIPLDAALQGQVQNARGTWALYEIMPLDSHEAFDSPSGANLTAEELQALMPQTQMNTAPGEYDALIAEYVQDGQPAPPDAPPDRLWQRVRFKQAHTIDVDGDASRFSQMFFDSTGRAIDPALQQGSPTQFQIGDEAVFDPITADDLVQQGIAEKVEPVYVRELRDYEYAFHQLWSHMVALDDDAAVLQRDIATLQADAASAAMNVTFRETEKAGLQTDLTQFQYERDQIRQYLANLQQLLASKRDDLSKVYRINNALDAEWTALQLHMAAEIDSRTLPGGRTSPTASDRTLLKP